MPLSSGQTFAEFTIVRLLGAGGMGEVYLAQHPRLPRREALKILPPELSTDLTYRERFEREADLAATLYHPHIVGVHDRGEFDGQLWISMDFVDGSDAARLLHDDYHGGMPAAIVTEIVAAVAAALDYAHSRSVLHRDVKPANMLLNSADDMSQRHIRLADFGIARRLDDISGLTSTNMTIGTLHYSAPEQLMDDAVDGRADQYALAASAFHLFCGSPPFRNTNPAVVISHHLNSDPPRLAELRPDLAQYSSVLARALAKQPDDRFTTCTEFAQALRACTESSADIASPWTRTQPAPVSTPTVARSTPEPNSDATNTHTPRRRALLAAAIAVALVAVASLLWRPWTSRQHEQAGTAVTALPPASSTSQSAVPVPTTEVMVQITTTTTATTAAAPAVPCVTGVDAPQVQEVVSRFTPTDIVPELNVLPNDMAIAHEGGNFDSCATLSAVFLGLNIGTGGTPRHVLLFHKGSYVGPATPDAHSYVSLDEALTTDDTVVLKYGTVGSCSACPDMTFTIVRFQWQGDHVQMIGAPPT